MHNAEAYRDIPGGEAPLALAAHTHGGQIRVPGTPQDVLDCVAANEGDPNAVAQCPAPDD